MRCDIDQPPVHGSASIHGPDPWRSLCHWTIDLYRWSYNLRGRIDSIVLNKQQSMEIEKFLPNGKKEKKWKGWKNKLRRGKLCYQKRHICIERFFFFFGWINWWSIFCLQRFFFMRNQSESKFGNFLHRRVLRRYRWFTSLNARRKQVNENMKTHWPTRDLFLMIYEQYGQFWRLFSRRVRNKKWRSKNHFRKGLLHFLESLKCSRRVMVFQATQLNVFLLEISSRAVAAAPHIMSFFSFCYYITTLIYP